jgi:hypothetical protein
MENRNSGGGNRRLLAKAAEEGGRRRRRRVSTVPAELQHGPNHPPLDGGGGGGHVGADFARRVGRGHPRRADRGLAHGLRRRRLLLRQKSHRRARVQRVRPLLDTRSRRASRRGRPAAAGGLRTGGCRIPPVGELGPDHAPVNGGAHGGGGGGLPVVRQVGRG